MRRITVYCGANAGNDPAFAAAAEALGTAMAAREIDLVYGGGKLGLMGIIADTVLAQGGKVTGVIPEMLRDLEVAHDRLSQLHIVEDMQQRKTRMFELADGFIALPGGIGTLEEIFEIWSGHSLGYHHKPFAILNVAGYWDRLIDLLDNMVAQGFVSAQRRQRLIIANDPDNCLAQLAMASTAVDSGFIW